MEGDEHKQGRRPVRWACVGLGGYAGGMSDLLWSLHEQGELRYVAACDPNLAANAPRVEKLRAGGVRVFESLSALLATDAEAVWLPVPIDLHRSFTTAALEAHKAVLCEKPAAGALGDVDAMIAARDVAKMPVAIGFQHVYDPAIAEIKRQLRSGLVGRVTYASVVVGWPRDDAYYHRNTWAARWKRGETWVLDSPVNNAMAHYLNLALFLLGAKAEASAVPVSIEAEHYRANPIETYDTAALRIRLEGGCELVVLLTHACAHTVDPTLVIRGELGELVLTPEHDAAIANWRSPVVPAGFPMKMATGFETRRGMVQTVSAAVRGQVPATPVATLESARVHSLIVSASVQVAPVQNVPDELIQVIKTPKQTTLRAVRGIEEVLERCVTEGKLPSETGLWPWAKGGASTALGAGWKFVGPASA